MAKVYELLPDELFTVRIPLGYVYTPEEMDIFGIPIEEDHRGNKTDIDDKFTVVKLPITRIIDIYTDGAPIYLTNSEEVYKLYKILEEYLINSNQGPITFNVSEHEEDRLEDIDRFASEVFDLNRHNIADHLNNRKRSGFDLGLPKFTLDNITNVKIVKGGGVMDAYAKENPSMNQTGSVLYGTTNEINPDKIYRKPKTRRRKVITVETP